MKFAFDKDWLSLDSDDRVIAAQGRRKNTSRK
ncbi:hypothetical protein ACVW1C_005538 [Bradyrhizobium sp. USDA 4011]